MEELQSDAGPNRQRRGRRAIAVIGALVSIALIVAISAPTASPSSEPILHERFDGSGTTTFSTDGDAAVDLRVIDGSYVATIKGATAPQIVRHVFDHTRDGVLFQAEIATDTTGMALASVGCWAGDSAYLLAVTSSGEALVLETVHDSTGERRPLTDPIPLDRRGVGVSRRFAIGCVGGGSDPTVVFGSVDGEPIVSLTIEDGYDSFDAVGFFLVTDTAGTTFTIDDVLAVEGRPDPPMSPVPPSAARFREATPTTETVSDDCRMVFDDAARALDDGDETAASDIVGFRAPKECASFAEVDAAATAALGPHDTEALGAYLTRGCRYVGPGMGLRETALCRELLGEAGQ